ncbi:hypothetical protein JCM10908_002516 [Rhodotorula pacifica]|uniref:uncharacterized protein n=1 Tax=Rhodotorula pacifica TaxID=1495444 RepID=UPI00316FC386
MHSVAYTSASDYAATTANDTRQLLALSSDRPHDSAARPSNSAYASTSAGPILQNTRQLPPGAAYAADHAVQQRHAVNHSSSSLPPSSSSLGAPRPSAPSPAGVRSVTPRGSQDNGLAGFASTSGGYMERPLHREEGGCPALTASGREPSQVSPPPAGAQMGASTSRDYDRGARPDAVEPARAAEKGQRAADESAAPWSISLQEPTPPPSQHFATSSIDARPSLVAKQGEVSSSRPHAPRPLPDPLCGTEDASSSGTTVRASAERPILAERHSFVGIPGGRLPSSTRAAVDATERQSRIPSFSPAAAFSPQDRGPYPPHTAVSPTRARFESAAAESEVLADRAQTYGSPVMSGAPELPPTDLGRPGSLAFDSSAFPSDLAGIGRNSVIRAAASPPLFTSTSSPIELNGGGGPATTSNPASAARSPQLVNASPQALAAAQQAQNASPGGAFSFPNQNLNASLVLPTPPPPPHLVPQPEICVECMMRDRDMADVDVTTPGVWERASDADFEEQMRWEAETTPDPAIASGGSGTPAASSSWSGEHAGAGSVESAVAGPSSKRRESSAAYSRESLGGRSSLAHGAGGSMTTKGRRRFGRGQLLTSGNLKVWTTMNPPAAAHRWRTLQTYLATQAHYLELDRQSREAETVQSLPVRLSQQTARTSQGGNRSRSSSMLSPAALAAEKAAMEQEERSRRAGGKARNPSRGTLVDETNRLSSASLLPPPIGMAPMQAPRRPTPIGSSGASMRSYSSGDQPWLGNQLRRISTAGRDLPPANASFDSSRSNRFTFSPFSRSAVDLRALPSPRSISPARTSDDRRTSMWSRFRRSGSPSVFSYAPSGSMLDMHLGLSQDKHMPYAAGYPAYETYPSRSDPAVARHAETARREEALAASQATGVSGESSAGKKKRKGIKGFFNKLVGGGGASGGKKALQTSISAPPTPGVEAAYEESYDDSELAPPPPLSALVNEPRYHQRSASNSSIDSFGPATPPVPGGSTFRSAGSMGYESGSLRSPADRQSVLTLGSLNSTRSRPIAANGHDSLRNGTSWPSADSLRDPAGFETGEHEILAGDEELAGDFGAPNPRPQKSLPLLPSETVYAYRTSLDSYGDPNLPLAPPNAPYAHYGASRSAYSLDRVSSPGNFAEEFGYEGRPEHGNGPGGGRDRSATVTHDGQTIRKARSRSKIFSMSFGKKSKHAENVPPPPPPLPHPNMRAHSLDSGVALGQAVGSPYREVVAGAGYA